MTFIRKFSLNLYKNLNIPLSKMTFTSDFISTVRGDLYPLISLSEGAVEHLHVSGYSVAGGSAERMLAEFFPYATYKMKISSLNGSAGFAFAGPDARCEVTVEKDEWESFVSVKHADGEAKFPLHREIREGFALIVTARPKFFDVYVADGDQIEFLATAEVPSFARSNKIAFISPSRQHGFSFSPIFWHYSTHPRP